jgi:hypothetical protein
MGLNGSTTAMGFVPLERPNTSWTGDYTVCFRAMWNIAPANDAFMSSQEDGSGIAIWNNITTNMRFQTEGTLFVTLNLAHADKGTGNWFWVAATVDVAPNLTITGWVDGETNSTTSVGVTSNGFYHSGATNWISYCTVVGNLDAAVRISDIMVFNRILSQDELETIRFSNGKLVSLDSLLYRRKFMWAKPGTAVDATDWPAAAWNGHVFTTGHAAGADAPTCEESPYGLRRRAA